MGLVAAETVPLTGAEAGQLRLRSNTALRTHHVASALTTPWPVGSQVPPHAVQPYVALAMEVVQYFFLVEAVVQYYCSQRGAPPSVQRQRFRADQTVHEGGAHLDGHLLFPSTMEHADHPADLVREGMEHGSSLRAEFEQPRCDAPRCDAAGGETTLEKMHPATLRVAFLYQTGIIRSSNRQKTIPK